MGKHKYRWVLGFVLLAVLIGVPLALFLPGPLVKAMKDPWASAAKNRTHLDHSAYFTKPFKTPGDVTSACLECHPNAAKDVMKTAHWNWEGDAVKVPGHAVPVKIGKKNLVNNYCIGIRGNWSECTACHIGYGWGDADFDFLKEENVDCLVCHDWTGTYAKGEKGLPKKEVDLKHVAQKVGYPRRDNCGTCHNSGGGGLAVKHGDLDHTLVNPTSYIDVHMGKFKFLCIDCHKTKNHNIKGKAYSVSVNHENGIDCTDCHDASPHIDQRINAHLDSVACQTCHIPTYAKKAPTKIFWDWSKAGDPDRKEDVFTYQKNRGEFIYQQDVIPEYTWFNLNAHRYLLGDKIDPEQVSFINKPMGDITDNSAKIWPFKIHRSKQPYDAINLYLLQPVTSGEGGYWSTFDWDASLRLGSEVTGIPFSGQYDFALTYMYWPLSHMVSPKSEALKCCHCHGENSRMDWQTLGYEGDPKKTGSRFQNGLNRN